MSANINLREIAIEALGTFPPLGNDNGAASNYAQRMLTKLLSEERQSGSDISEDAAQTMRASLDQEMNSIEIAAEPAPSFETKKQAVPKSQPAEIGQLTSIISDSFHTSTDGSQEHLAHLRQRALQNAANYLKNTNAGWLTRLRFMKHTKRLIRNHIEQMRRK